MSSHPPIAVMSFNRPDYLRQVLTSLTQQECVEIEKRQVFLFQDGAVNAYSGRVCAEEADVAACIAVFQEIFPNGTVLASPHNLGVCENFLRAEKKFFEEMQAECGYFFEDDLVLAPRYLAIMDGMRQAAAQSGQVGYFACYGHLQASAEEQQRNAQLLRRLGHLWGFGLFRHHWLEMQPVMAEYYAMVVGKDYKARPSAEIQKRYRERGILVGVTSQDDVKKAVTYSLGRVALNTQICSARYIGEVGLHSNAQSFARGGFANTVILPMPRLDFIFPDAAAIAAIRADEEEKRRKNIASEEARAAEKLAARAAAKAPPKPAPKLPPVAVPPPQPGMETAKLGPPRMSAEERALFENVLASGRRRYAEFGTGGSTLLAVRQGFDMLVGVESDPAWAEAVRQDPDVGQAIAAGRASILHGDIGPVGKWGSPVDRAGLHRWPGYIATMWQEWDRRAAFPDLVLVDGRFRVACCLSVALLAAARGGKESPLLVLHDVSDRRPNYRLVNDFFHLERQAGTLCVYAPRQLVSPEAIMAAFIGRLFEVG